MIKKYYRFFGGFLKSQEKWLNKMADRGYRLIRSGRATYEFEKCDPMKYRYAVEFVGEKSVRDAHEYAAFLEDCGYRVIFKNINLDYSVAKIVFRPWAKKGGKIATTHGAYNRELLIIEKENDGKPFELHTTEEDIREYKNNVRKPWIFLIASALIISFMICGAIALTSSLGIENARSATRIGYVGSEGRNSWYGKYAKLDGKMNKIISSSDGVLEIDIKTLDGSISIEIYDMEDNLLYSDENLMTNYFTVEIPSKVKVRIISKNHKGSFNIKG